MGVEDVLSVKFLFEVNKPLNQGVSCGPPQYVVQASRREHPHGLDLLPVVDLKSMGQVSNGAPRDGHPVYVYWVRRTSYSGVTRKVEIVQLTVGKTDIEALLWNGQVHAHAGGAHVVEVVKGVLHPCHHPDLSG